MIEKEVEEDQQFVTIRAETIQLIKSMDDFKKWEDFDKNKLAEISHDRVFVYDHTSNDDVWNYALENGFRYFVHSEKTKNLPFYK